MTFSNIISLLGTLPFSERISYGGKVFVVGMTTVFSVLIILWLVLLLFRLFFYDIPEKRNSKPLPVKTELPDNEPVAFEIKSGENTVDDGELIAVITAAIEAYNAQAGNALPFRVVSYKRVRGANGWNGNDNNETI